MNFEYRSFSSQNNSVSMIEDVAPVCLVVENTNDTACIPLYCFDDTVQTLVNGFKRKDRMLNGLLIPLNLKRVIGNPDIKYIYDNFVDGTGLNRFKYKNGEYIVGPGLLYDMTKMKLLVLVCRKVFFKNTDGFLEPRVEEIPFLIDPSFLTSGNHPIRRKIFSKLDRACYDYKVHVRHLNNLSTAIIHNKPLCNTQEKKVHGRADKLADNILTNLCLMS